MSAAALPRAVTAPAFTHRLSRGDWIALGGVCVLAAVVRLGVRARFPGVVHPDETYQYLEQAHRLVFGTGLEPWEFVVGLRSWLFPGMLAGIMALSRPLGTQPDAYLWPIAGVMVLASLPTIAVAYLWGRRSAGMLGGILAAGLPAVWFETAYYAAHPLADSLGAALLIPGVYIVDSVRWMPGRRRLAWGGALLAMAVALRAQLTPAAVLTALAVCRLEWRARWAPLLAGAAAPLVLLGVFDWITLGRPLQSMWYYAWVNIGLGVASAFGAMPWHMYVHQEMTAWSRAGPLILATALIGAWRRPLLLGNAAVLLLALSAIEHKELRYVLAPLTLVLILAGIGTAVVAGWVRARLWRRLPDAAVAATCVLGWAAISAWYAPRTFADWLHNGVAMHEAMNAISNDPSACGLAVSPEDQFSWMGGYVHLRPGIPLYALAWPELPPSPSAYDRIMTLTPPEAVLPDYGASGFTREACFTQTQPGEMAQLVCLWHRPGPCAVGVPVLRPAMPAFMDRLR